MNLIYSLCSIANLLSIIRIFLAIPLYYSLSNMNPNSSLYDIYVFLFICTLIALSDILDGYFARLFDSVTDIGKFLDPIADKVCLTVFILSLILSNNDAVRQYNSPLINLFICLLVRDIAISFFSVYFARKKRIFFQANLYGKWFLFFIAMTMVFSVLNISELINPDPIVDVANSIFFKLSWIFFILSTYRYFSKYIGLLRS